MLKSMIAKYPGKCAISGVQINRGDSITYCTDTRKAYLTEPGDCQIDIKPDQGRYISDVYRFSSGAVVYQNKKGRCIDAPCCGCCTG